MAQTNEALQNNKLTNLTLGSSAAAAILLPQAVTKAAPQLLQSLRPSQRKPYPTARASAAAVEAAVLAA